MCGADETRKKAMFWKNTCVCVDNALEKKIRKWYIDSVKKEKKMAQRLKTS